MAKKAMIIGSGFAGLSAACFLAKAGWEVDVIEKNSQPGGRAGKLEEDGFVFDMGPSWYWMPDVFERFFNQFGKNRSDYYGLKRLDPSYRIYWENEFIDIPAEYRSLKYLFDRMETGAGEKLDLFIREAAYKYQVGMQKLVFKPGQSLLEFLDWELISGLFRLDVFSSIKNHVHKFFKDERICQILEFPVLFLGALPEQMPALYSLMNYADIKGGTWYPDGGIFAVVQAMFDLSRELGVRFHFNENVNEIVLKQKRVTGLRTETSEYSGADAIIASADYHHVETQLLPTEYRSYSPKYWESRVMAPSCLVYYIGLNKKLKYLAHHSLFFDTDFKRHSEAIYKEKKWPSEPLFYLSATSVTDNNVAPAGHENLFFLIPLAAGLEPDDESRREECFRSILKRAETRLGETLEDAIVYKRSFCLKDFSTRYNSFKGNAYGLANTLRQTAILKPGIRSKKLKNLFFAGQLTLPGPGIPPSLISGELAAQTAIISV